MSDSTLHIQTDPTQADLVQRANLVLRLRRAYERCAYFPEDMPDGFARLIDLRGIVPDVLYELEKDLPRRSLEPEGQERFEFGQS